MQMAKMTALGIGLKDRKENFVLTLDPSQLKPGVCFYLSSLPKNIALESFFCVNFLSSKNNPEYFFKQSLFSTQRNIFVSQFASVKRGEDPCVIGIDENALSSLGTFLRPSWQCVMKADAYYLFGHTPSTPMSRVRLVPIQPLLCFKRQCRPKNLSRYFPARKRLLAAIRKCLNAPTIE